MRNEGGFTILEALFSMAIFAVAMLGVIGLQLNAMQTDEDTRRKDMAAQLLTTGVEMVECADYESSAIFLTTNTINTSGNSENDFSAFLKNVRDGATNSWMAWRNGDARLFLRHEVDSRDVDSDGNIDFSVRNVYLVASWDSIKSGQRETLSRMIVKPENTLQ